MHESGTIWEDILINCYEPKASENTSINLKWKVILIVYVKKTVNVQRYL